MNDRDWSSCRADRKCADCVHSGPYQGYPVEKVRVCRHPEVLKITQGPRSCQDLVRSPSGVCGPDAVKFEPRKR